MTVCTTNYKPPTIEEIRAARKKEVIVAMYTVFGDESHDPKQERVFAVAGVIGTQEEWDALEVKWKERANGKIFHAADCESNPPRGEFKNTSHEDNLKLYRDLVSILADSPIMGFGAVIDLLAYKTYFPDVVDYISYIQCFRRVIEHFAQLVHVLMPRDNVKFVFDTNSRVQYTAGELYDIYSNNPNWEYNKYLIDDGIQFHSKNKFIIIQVADLYTREIMKDGDNYFNYMRGSSRRYVRESFKKLRDTHKFSAHYYEKGYWEDYKKKFPDIEKHAGLSRDDYAKWLDGNGLVDNLPNRTHYLKYLTDADKQKDV